MFNGIDNGKRPFTFREIRKFVYAIFEHFNLRAKLQHTTGNESVKGARENAIGNEHHSLMNVRQPIHSARRYFIGIPLQDWQIVSIH